MKYKKYRIVSFIMILAAFSSLFQGCSSKVSSKENSKSNFDIKDTVRIVDSYMESLMAGDYDKCMSMYTEELQKKTLKDANNDIPILSYRIDEINEVGRTGMIKVKVSRGIENNPSSVLHEYTFKVVKKDDEYKIDSIVSVPQKEVFQKGSTLRIRDKNNVKTNLLVNISGIPKYAFSKNDKGEMVQIKSPLKNFGLCSFAYLGTKIAISTNDNKDSYICITNIDETQSTAADGNQMDNENSEEGNASPGIVKEIPVGKEIISLDIVKNSSVTLMAFSLDEKFIVVSFKTSKNEKYIKVYNASSGELIPFSFEKEYNIKENDLVFAKFEKNFLIYKVVPKDGSKAAIWQLDLKKFKDEKVS